MSMRTETCNSGLSTATVRATHSKPSSGSPARRRHRNAAPRPVRRCIEGASRRGPIAPLIIDYGHTTPAAGDTLQAVRCHGYRVAADLAGEADLTVHVNFYDLASTLHRAGLALDGPVMQAEFLGSLGIVERASRLMAANPKRAGEIETASPGSLRRMAWVRVSRC